MNLKINSNESLGPSAGIDDIFALVELQNYNEAIETSKVGLQETPSDFQLLTALGIASVYNGINQVDYDAKQNYLNEGVFALRQAIIFSNESFLLKEIQYVLGLAYHHKGYFYQDLALKYLELSLENGYSSGEIYENLGFVSEELELLNQSLEYYTEALEHNKRDELYLRLASVSRETGNINGAIQYLKELINQTDDLALVQEAMLMRGELHFLEQNFAEAQQDFQTVIEKNDQNDLAYFYLGEIYSAQGNEFEARAQWRLAYQANPQNRAALQRLNDN